MVSSNSAFPPPPPPFEEPFPPAPGDVFPSPPPPMLEEEEPLALSGLPAPQVSLHQIFVVGGGGEEAMKLIAVTLVGELAC